MDQAGEGDEEEEGAALLGGDGDEAGLPASPTDGWEAVAPPPASEEHGRGWEMVAGARGASVYDDGRSVFPPGDHEGLHVEHSLVATPEGGSRAGCAGGESVAAPSSPPSSSSSCIGDGADRQLRPAGERKPFVELAAFMGLARRAVLSGCDLLYLKLPRPGSAGMKQGGIWSLAGLAGLAAALLYIRRRFQREKLRLLLLIQEKDQKISQLLLQIAKMNEAMSSCRRVPVLRSA